MLKIQYRPSIEINYKNGTIHYAIIHVTQKGNWKIPAVRLGLQLDQHPRTDQGEASSTSRVVFPVESIITAHHTRRIIDTVKISIATISTIPPAAAFPYCTVSISIAVVVHVWSREFVSIARPEAVSRWFVEIERNNMAMYRNRCRDPG